NLAKDTILSILEKNSMALKEPAPLVRVGAFNNSSIDIFIKVWVKGSDYWDLNYDLLEQIKEGFDNNNIIIPFNKLDVNIFSK
ncbi:MAG: mechanosensitive ion channel, partial [Oscillospiraceae bacterium]